MHHLVGAFAVFTLPSNFTWEANLAQGEVSLVTDTLRRTHILFFKELKLLSNYSLGKLNRNRYLNTKTRLTFVHQSDYILATF